MRVRVRLAEAELAAVRRLGAMHAHVRASDGLCHAMRVRAPLEAHRDDLAPPLVIASNSTNSCISLERKPQLPEQENLLKSPQVPVAVEPITRIAPRRRRKRADLVVVSQRADAHARKIAHPPGRLHECLPLTML